MVKAYRGLPRGARGLPWAPGYYVTRSGEVWSLRGRGGGCGRAFKMVVKPHFRTGYLKIGLWVDGVQRHFLVHRLVAEMFCKRGPGQDEVRHKNRTPADCRSSNLRWGTRVENAGDMWAHGTVLIGENANSAVLTEAKVREIRQRHAAGESYRALARAFGVDRGTIKSAVTRETWRHVE